MPWKIKFSAKAEKEFLKLEKAVQKRISKAISEKLEVNPLSHLVELKSKLKGLYKFRVGDYRLICKKEENILIIMVLTLGHRKEIYKIN